MKKGFAETRGLFWPSPKPYSDRATISGESEHELRRDQEDCRGMLGCDLNETTSISDCDVVRLLIQETRSRSPRGKTEQWKRFDELRNLVAHNCTDVSVEGGSKFEELVHYVDFAAGAEHAFRYGLFGFDMEFRHPNRGIEDFRAKKEYAGLSRVIEASLVAT